MSRPDVVEFLYGRYRGIHVTMGSLKTQLAPVEERHYVGISSRKFRKLEQRELFANIHALDRQHADLRVRAAGSGEAARHTIGSEYAMARHNNWERVLSQRLTDSTCKQRIT